MQDTWPATPALPLQAKPLPATLSRDGRGARPLTALAPMQDVTDLDFMRIVARRGAPDYFVTEYFRVHGTSVPEAHIVRSAVENDTGRPVFAQLLGESLSDLGRTVRQLESMPWAGIDLNMGCPAPKIYRKNVGGGLLRDPAKVDELLGFLRSEVRGVFTVKMRIGFEDDVHFERLLELVGRHGVELLTLHARTVREMYRSGVHYEYHRRAVERLPCPVVANGNVTSAKKALEVIERTGAAGVMVGRSAIRNPWIFDQIHRALEGRPARPVFLGEVHGYITDLHDATRHEGIPETAHVNKLKKYLNFIGLGVDPEGRFLHEIRRARSRDEFFALCERHLLARHDTLFADEPYPGLIARPSREAPEDGDGCSL